MNSKLGEIKWYWVVLGAIALVVLYGVVKHMLIVQNIIAMPNGGTYIQSSFLRPYSSDEANKIGEAEEAKLNPTPTKK